MHLLQLCAHRVTKRWNFFGESIFGSLIIAVELKLIRVGYNFTQMEEACDAIASAQALKLNFVTKFAWEAPIRYHMVRNWQPLLLMWQFSCFPSILLYILWNCCIVYVSVTLFCVYLRLWVQSFLSRISYLNFIALLK